jgi:hypothetical protein
MSMQCAKHQSCSPSVHIGMHKVLFYFARILYVLEWDFIHLQFRGPQPLDRKLWIETHLI